MLEQVRDDLYKINKNQYLKINKKGNGGIVAPARDPVTKQLNWYNIFFTGGTIWGSIKVGLIVLFLLFLLWRYNVEVASCIELMESFNPETGYVNQDYFNKYNPNLKEVYDEQTDFSLLSFAESNDKPLS